MLVKPLCYVTSNGISIYLYIVTVLKVSSKINVESDLNFSDIMLALFKISVRSSILFLVFLQLICGNLDLMAELIFYLNLN